MAKSDLAEYPGEESSVEAGPSWSRANGTISTAATGAVAKSADEVQPRGSQCAVPHRMSTCHGHTSWTRSFRSSRTSPRSASQSEQAEQNVDRPLLHVAKHWPKCATNALLSGHRLSLWPRRRPGRYRNMELFTDLCAR